MSNNNVSIEQINLAFNQQEDRLLLKVGMADQSEIAVWITRRICKDLWHLLQNSHNEILDHLKQSAHAKEAQKSAPISKAPQAPRLVQSSKTAQALPTPTLVKKKVIDDFERAQKTQQALETMDFSREYQDNRTPMLAEPMLVVECHVDTTQAAIFQLVFKAVQGESIKMGLTLELLVALTNMMQLATREAGWDLLMLQYNVAKHLYPNEQVLH